MEVILEVNGSYFREVSIACGSYIRGKPTLWRSNIRVKTTCIVEVMLEELEVILEEYLSKLTSIYIFYTKIFLNTLSTLCSTQIILYCNASIISSGSYFRGQLIKSGSYFRGFG